MGENDRNRTNGRLRGKKEARERECACIVSVCERDDKKRIRSGFRIKMMRQRRMSRGKAFCKN